MKSQKGENQLGLGSVGVVQHSEANDNDTTSSDRARGQSTSVNDDLNVPSLQPEFYGEQGGATLVRNLKDRISTTAPPIEPEVIGALHTISHETDSDAGKNLFLDNKNNRDISTPNLKPRTASEDFLSGALRSANQQHINTDKEDSDASEFAIKGDRTEPQDTQELSNMSSSMAAPRLSNSFSKNVATNVRATRRDDQAVKEGERRARQALAKRNISINTSNNNIGEAEVFAPFLLSTEQSTGPSWHAGHRNNKPATVQATANPMLVPSNNLVEESHSSHPPPLLTSSTTTQKSSSSTKGTTRNREVCKASMSRSTLAKSNTDSSMLRAAVGDRPSQAQTIFNSKTSDIDANNSNDNALVGAIGVLSSGLTVQQRPAVLGDHPRGMSTPTIQLPSEHSIQNPPGAIHISTTRNDRDEMDPEPQSPMKVDTANDEHNRKRQVDDLPWYRRRLFYVGVVLLVTLAAGIGTGVSLSDEKGNGNEPSLLPSNPTFAPTLSPTTAASSIYADIELWDPQRRDASEFYIVETYELTQRNTLRDIRSPQFAAWSWLVNEDRFSTMDQEEIPIMLNRYVLAVVYFALEGDGWDYPLSDNPSQWLQADTSHCDWDYVSCDPSRVQVVEIWTGGRPGANIEGGAVNMRGTLPKEMNFWRQNLTTLRVPGNEIYNVDALSDFTNLSVLDLAGNQIQSSDIIYQLSSIQTLSLQQCKLEGLVPDLRNMTNLLSFSIADNQLSGVITNQFDTDGLRDMVAMSNRMEGNIMDILQGHEDGLRFVRFDANRISGSINALIGDFITLNALVFSRNDLTGSIPTELAFLPELADISLDGNGRLVGLLPTEMGSLSRLENLNLASTSVEGPIPEEWMGMSSLKRLDLSFSFVTGTVPRAFCNLESLQIIDSTMTSLDCNGCSKCR